eukprot:GFUD01064479.1.p1 GENE.GFUD01064479.1~~GFUD01064479.1.p1  ORF type:complete len:317 (-),score=52.53 GFUD01064479.1:359-1309(-)
MDENEFHQRQPLLSGDLEDLEEHNLTSISPRVRNGSAVKIEIEMPSCERLEASLSITHELRNTALPPLPDLVLDHLPYHKGALDVSEILIMIATIVAALVVVFHKHRCILIRRICVIVGLLYGYRAITMIVTVLPSANKEYHCDVQLNHTISTGEVVHRVLKIMSGFGLSINGQHIYCGDFIFSGHTMILILCYLIIVEYTPVCLWLLHWLLWLVALSGVSMLMISRGHYTIDVIIAYFVTTRLWYMHNAIIANRHFQQRASTNHLGRLWWWRLAVWFEDNVKGPVPAQFEFPNPWSFSFNSVTTKSRARDPARDI